MTAQGSEGDVAAETCGNICCSFTELHFSPAYTKVFALVLEIHCSVQIRQYVMPNSHLLIISHRVSFGALSSKYAVK